MRAHRANMRGTYLGLLGAFLGAVAVPQRDIPSLVRENPIGFVAIVALLLAMSAVVIFGVRAIAQSRPRRSGD